MNEVEQAAWSVNADLPAASLRTMQEIHSKSLARTSFTLTMLGTAAGVARLMKTLLYGVSRLDPFSFAAVPLILLAAAALASFLPALRVAAISPVEALKAE